MLGISLFSCEEKQEVDMIVHNALIYTVNENFDTVNAFAIKDGKFLEVGDYYEIHKKYVAKKDINAEGKYIYPGFYDAHAHFFGYADFLRSANLRGSESFEEVLERLVNHRKEFPNDKWLLGRGWDQNLWEVKEFPDRAKLDSLFPDIPVLTTRVDGHAALVNGKVLELLNISPDTEIMGGKMIVENGRSTGILIDKVEEMANAIVPERTNPEKAESYIYAQEKCLAVGLTSIVDAGIDNETVLFADSLYNTGDLKIKLNVMLSPEEANFEFARKNGVYQNKGLHVTAFKIYSDGALGSRGACLIDEYSDDKGNYGFLKSPISYFDSMANIINELNFQMNTHAIGDSANRAILKIYAKYLDKENSKRWRIEHAQVVNPADLKYFKDYKVIPSVQPTHCTSDMFWADERLGDDRIKHAYTYKSLLDQVGMLALGSDFPVEDINPLYGFHAAVARVDKNDKPEGGFQIDEAISRETALKGMTIWAAYSAFEENERGSIEVGKEADWVMLESDIMMADEEDIRDTKVILTVINGEVVYENY